MGRALKLHYFVWKKNDFKMNSYMPIVLALAILMIVVPQILLLIFVCCKFSRTCQNCYQRLLGRTVHRGTNADDDLEAIVENEHPIAIENENYEEPPPSWIE